MDILKLYELYQAHPLITTDSRNCPADSIFFALKGESFDGNKFARTALDKGCSYAVIDDKTQAEPYDDRLILVDDTLRTFKELAREHRRHFHIPVIGITGTNGKTTTKELIGAVLRMKYNVMTTQGNFNNDIGVPKTLFTLNNSHEIAVVEMGASHPGDIRRLVKYVEPTCGLITNVGRAHLQGFGSFEGVKSTKGELYDYLAVTKSQLFINIDDNNLKEMARQRGLIEDSIRYSMNGNENAVINGRLSSCDPYIVFTYTETNEAGCKVDSEKIRTCLIGSYNMANLLAAVCVGRHFGVTAAQIKQALEHYIPNNDRSELRLTACNRLIIDAYNANPSSMAAALQNFRQMRGEHKMVILGDMRELGAASEEEHRKIVDFLSKSNFETVWLVGDLFKKVNRSFRTFSNVDEVKTVLRHSPVKGKLILIKGSNSGKLFQLSDIL